MIAERAHDYTVESTVTGKKIEMGIAQNALAHIMDVLTNLYGDRQMAVLREYSTNARDAHVEAGITRPIEVTLPSALSPSLRIQDYGVGMNADDIEQIYSQYGASTKRGTNDQVGMLGLGCKSALTYSAQFSVISIKDHIRTTVSVSRDDDGIASMTIPTTVSTTEDDGTSVIIPARLDNAFERKAKELFSYWEPGTVLVNGRPPQPIEGLEITKDVIHLIEVDDKPTPVSIKRVLVVKGADQNKVVMGGVPYPASFYFAPKESSIVAFVDIGEINFAPSREKLTDTTRTKRALTAIEQVYKEGIGDAIQRNIDQATDLRTALRVAADWRWALSQGRAEFTFKGKDIPSHFEWPTVTDENGVVTSRGESWIVTMPRSRPLNKSSRMASIPAGTALDALWIHGFTASKLTAAHKKRLDKYAALKGLTPEHYVLGSRQFVSEWLDDAQHVDWEDIRQIALERTIGSRPARLSGSYDVYCGAGYGSIRPTQTLAKDIKTADGLFFVDTTRFGKQTAKTFVRFLVATHRNCAVALMSTNRVTKFQRDFPMAIAAEDEVRRLHRETLQAIRKSDQIARRLWADHGGKRYAKLDPKRIDDPRLCGVIRAARRDVSKVEKKLARFSDLQRILDLPVQQTNWKNPFTDYPLFHSSMRYIDEYGSKITVGHVYEYLNAVYAARKES